VNSERSVVMLYGKASGHQFGWDGSDLTYEGVVVASEPSCDGVTLNSEECCLYASRYLSGFHEHMCVNIRLGEQERHYVTFWDGTRMAHAQLESPVLGSRDPKLPICVSGDVSPHRISEIGRRYPFARIYVCPIQEPLSALGVLVARMNIDGVHPCRTSFFSKNEDGIEDVVSQEFSKEFEYDCIGRLAGGVSLGIPNVNQICTSPQLPVFYERVLAVGSKVEDRIFMISCSNVDEFFPYEPISLKMYASCSVPVVGVPSESFKKDSGVDTDEVVFFVASDHLPYSATFMNFLSLAGKRRIVESLPLSSVSGIKSVPFFRYDRMYLVNGDWAVQNV